MAIGIGGCFSSRPGDIEAFLRPEQVVVTAETYVLAPPDEIEIHSSKVPELDLQRQRIRPDGKVSFEGLGEVEAAGRTPGQLAEVLSAKAKTLYTLPGENLIDVRIVEYQSKVYHVLGEVYFNGPRTYTGRDTVLTALATARPTVLAWKERVQIIRPSSNPKGRPKIFEVNYDRMIAHGDMRKNVLLQEGDIIFVPPTVLAAIGMKVEELVRPIARAFSTVNIVSGQPTRRQ
jgi:protein involved in polysaccharide export with SLBB domain